MYCNDLRGKLKDQPKVNHPLSRSLFCVRHIFYSVVAQFRFKSCILIMILLFISLYFVSKTMIITACVTDCHFPMLSKQRCVLTNRLATRALHFQVKSLHWLCCCIGCGLHFTHSSGHARYSYELHCFWKLPSHEYVFRIQLCPCVFSVAQCNLIPWLRFWLLWFKVI